MVEDVDLEPKKKNDDDGTKNKNANQLFTMRTLYDAEIDSESND